MTEIGEPNNFIVKQLHSEIQNLKYRQKVEEFNILLECLLPYTHPHVYPKCIGSGIQNTRKPNKLLSLMTVCRYDFHDGAMAYILQFG